MDLTILLLLTTLHLSHATTTNPLLTTIFAPQPPPCQTCLYPALTACEAAIGPPAADPASFASCICAPASLARVAILCLGINWPCAAQTDSVAGAAQTWCFRNDVVFRDRACQAAAWGVKHVKRMVDIHDGWAWSGCEYERE